jgi:capsid protein
MRGPVPHEWFFDGHEHVDPVKEAKAQETHLQNLTTTYAAEYAKQGKDYEKELDQCFSEIAFKKACMKKYHLTPDDLSDKQMAVLDKDDDDEEE